MWCAEHGGYELFCTCVPVFNSAVVSRTDSLFVCVWWRVLVVAAIAASGDKNFTIKHSSKVRADSNAAQSSTLRTQLQLFCAHSRVKGQNGARRALNEADMDMAAAPATAQTQTSGELPAQISEGTKHAPRCKRNSNCLHTLLGTETYKTLFGRFIKR